MAISGLERIYTRRGYAPLAAVALAGALAGSAQAEVVTYTGESLVDATNWHVSTNWRDQNGSHVVPTSADDAVIPSGRTASLVTGDAAVQSVVLDTSAHLDVDGQTLSVGTNAPGCSVFGGSCSRFSGIVRVVSEGTLVLGGDATWSNGGWLVDGTVENRGNLRITGNTRASASLNDLGLVRNVPGATISRTASAGQADIAVPLDNDGQVNVDTGTLLLQGGSGAETSSGSFALAQAGTLTSLGGHRLSPGGRVTGPGTLRLDAGVFEFAGGIGPGGAYAPGTTLASGGMLDLGGGSGSSGRLTSDGSGGGVRGGTLAVGAGESNFNEITFEGAANVTFAPGARTSATGVLRIRGNSTLALNGLTTWSDGGWTIGRGGLPDDPIGGTVENRGNLRITGNALATNFGVGGGLVRNLAGATITRDTSRGTATFALKLRNAGQITVQTGTLATTDVTQTLGEIGVAPGATLGAATGSPLTLSAGALRGGGTVRGVVTNEGGSVRPGALRPGASPGVLTIDGTYTQGASGTLEADIHGLVPGTAHDRLAVSGTATLGGTLAIATGGGFDPPLGSTYDVITADRRDGEFATLTGSELSRKHYRAEYDPTVARLRISGVAAEQIIFIHGFLGSRVACNGDDAWPRIPARALAMRLGPDGDMDLAGPCVVPEGGRGLVESVGTADVYGPTVQFLERVAPRDFHILSWDWRRSPERSLALLDSLVDRVRGNGKVVLMAHSMGGLLTRWYIDDPARAAKVARAVTIGTPYWGAPKALFSLAAGVETPRTVDDELDALFINSQMREFARNLQGLYFLWPSAEYGPWLHVRGRQPEPLDRSGVLSYADELGGNSELLKRAHDGHEAHLDRLKPNGVDYQVVVGTGLASIGQVRIIPTLAGAGTYEVVWHDGDMTVPRRSARHDVPDGQLHFVCGIKHLALPGDPAVTERITDFLLEGKPITGPQQDCPVEGVEVDTFSTLSLGGASAAPGSMTLTEAARTGLVELLDLGDQKLLAANASQPVKLSLRARRLGLRVTPLRGGRRGTPRYYGPVSGTITIDAAADAVIRKGGRRLTARRGADTQPPRTRVRLRLRGRHALVRVRASDDSAVAATYARLGRQPARRVRRTLRVKRSDLRRVRLQSLDVFGNAERPRRIRITP